MDPPSNKAEGDGDATSRPPAPDVSHVIIERLLRENENLREQRNSSFQVEITGDSGSPLYATGSLQRGRWRGYYGGLWDVDLNMTAEVPISAIDSIEIYLGGVLYASSLNIAAQMDDDDWDHENGKQVQCHFRGAAEAWLPIRISGWPENHWSIVRDLDYASRGTAEDFDVNHVLLKQLPRQLPDATLSFNQMSFFGNCVEKILKNNNLGQISEDEKREQREWSIFYSLIIRCVREANRTEYGKAFLDRVDAVARATYMLESQEVAEEEILTLVEMQLAAQSHTEFISSVRERYAGVLIDRVPDDDA